MASGEVLGFDGSITTPPLSESTIPLAWADLRGRVEELVDHVLLPRATEVDRGDVFPVDNLQALASLDLFGMAVPTDRGGLGFRPPETRAALRLLSSGCGATTFAFAQHHGAVAAVASTDNGQLRDRWLPRLLDRTLAGTAFAHVRRRGEPVLRAMRDGEDWLLEGSAPWVTSWGAAQVMTVAARTEDGGLLWALLDMAEVGGLRVDRRFDLMVFQATQTVALRFDACRVPAERVLNIVDFEPWAIRDRALSARPSPLALGIGDRALIELGRVAADIADSMTAWWRDQVGAAEAQCRRVDEAIAEGTVDDDLVDETARARTSTLLAVQRLTTALLAASGGSAIERSHTAQRLAREALFYVIQAQSPDGKRATLEALDPP